MRTTTTTTTTATTTTKGYFTGWRFNADLGAWFPVQK